MIDKAGAFKEGRQLLTDAVQRILEGNLDELQKLLGSNPEDHLNEIIEGNGRKLLHFAASGGQLHILE